MKKIIIFLFAFFNSVFFSPILAQNYSQKINNFTSEIEVNHDRSLDIKETIEFETEIPKHGIYRYIPDTEFLNGALRFVDKRKIKVFSVRDEVGKNYQFEKSFSDGSIFLKIGDPNKTFTGKKTYVISYNISDAVRLMTDENGKEKVRLLWDITGEGWNFPILKSQAIVRSPEKITGIELGWANLFEVPIVCFSREGAKTSGSLNAVCNDFFEYRDLSDFEEKVEKAVEDKQTK